MMKLLEDKDRKEEGMTREVAIKELKQFSGTTRLRLSANFWAAQNRAIKALEQEPVLDKIRAEINELPSYVAKFNGGDFAIHIDKEKVFEIIDKYEAESEDKE